MPHCEIWEQWRRREDHRHFRDRREKQTMHKESGTNTSVRLVYICMEGIKVVEQHVQNTEGRFFPTKGSLLIQAINQSPSARGDKDIFETGKISINLPVENLSWKEILFYQNKGGNQKKKKTFDTGNRKSSTEERGKRDPQGDSGERT